MEKNRPLMEIGEARRVIREHLVSRSAVPMPLNLACGRILAQPLLARNDAPAFDHSAMDGFAIAGESFGPHPIFTESVEADWFPPGGVGAQRVATGYPVPAWAHCVVPIEQGAILPEGLVIDPSARLASGTFIRRRGGSFRAGAEVLAAGSLLTPGALALAASCGCATLPVHQPVQALHIATGSELVVPPAPLAHGQVYDSNSPMMVALLQERGIACSNLRNGDDAEILSRALAEFSGDLILISGGTGPGEQDHATEALQRAGFSRHISGVRSRPGKPLIFATRGSQVAFGLPGNPLSHWVCFHVFVRTALDAWNGRPMADLTPAHCATWPTNEGDGRPTWTPAVSKMEEGRLVVHPLPWQHSGDLLPLARANALAFGAPSPETGLILTLPLE